MSSSDSTTQENKRRKPYKLLSTRQKRRRVASELKCSTSDRKLGLDFNPHRTLADASIHKRDYSSHLLTQDISRQQSDSSMDYSSDESIDELLRKAYGREPSIGCDNCAELLLQIVDKWANKHMNVSHSDLSALLQPLSKVFPGIPKSVLSIRGNIPDWIPNLKGAQTSRPTAAREFTGKSLPLNLPSHACTCCTVHGHKTEEMNSLKKLIESTAKNVQNMKFMMEESRSQQQQELVVEHTFIHPAQTLQELDNIARDHHFAGKLKHHKGFSTRDTVRKILKAALTREFAIKFSFTGFGRHRVKNKMCFADTLFCKKLFENAASFNFHGSKKELAKEIQVCLRSASDWRGARGAKAASAASKTAKKTASAAPKTVNKKGARAAEIQDAGLDENVAGVDENVAGAVEVEDTAPRADHERAVDQSASSIDADSKADLTFPIRIYLDSDIPMLKTEESSEIVSSDCLALRSLRIKPFN